MFKKFCDRCDREITKEDNVRSITICKKLPNPTDLGKVYGKPIHLCEDCANAFYDWMKSYSPIQQLVEDFRKEESVDEYVAPKETESGAIAMSPDNTEDSLWEMEMYTDDDAVEAIEGLPAAQPEIIRCGQCKYAEVADKEDTQDGYTCQFHRGSIWFSGSYCSWAERRTE